MMHRHFYSLPDVGCKSTVFGDIGVQIREAVHVLNFTVYDIQAGITLTVDIRHLHFLALSFKQTIGELLSNFVVLSFCTGEVNDSIAMSSAKSRSPSMVVKSNWIPVRSSLTVCCLVYYQKEQELWHEEALLYAGNNRKRGCDLIVFNHRTWELFV